MSVYRTIGPLVYILVGGISYSLQILDKIAQIMLFGLLELLQGIEQRYNFMFYTFALIRAAKIMKMCILSSPHNV